MKYFFLYSHCYLVHGERNSTINDVMQKRTFWVKEPWQIGFLTLMQECLSIDEAAVRLECSADKLHAYAAFLRTMDLGDMRATPAVAMKYRPFTQNSLERKDGYHRALQIATLEVATSCPGACDLCRPEDRLASSECACGIYSEHASLQYDLDRVIQLLSYEKTRLIEVAGGEPYAERDRVEAILAAGRRHGVPVVVKTPGLLLTENDIVTLKRYDAALALVLCDPDISRPSDRKWGMLQDIMRWSAKAGFARLDLRLFVGAAGLPSLHETLDWFTKNNAPVSASFLRYPRETSRLDRDAYLNTIEDAVPREHHYYAVGVDELARTVKGHACWQDRVAIMLNGDVKPCTASGRAPFGNLLQAHLLDILREGRPASITEAGQAGCQPCGGCELRLGCFTCAVATEKVRGTFPAQGWNCAYRPREGSFEPRPQGA